jgi:hypothetical protein
MMVDLAHVLCIDIEIQFVRYLAVRTLAFNKTCFYFGILFINLFQMDEISQHRGVVIEISLEKV